MRDASQRLGGGDGGGSPVDLAAQRLPEGVLSGVLNGVPLGVGDRNRRVVRELILLVSGRDGQQNVVLPETGLNRRLIRVLLRVHSAERIYEHDKQPVRRLGGDLLQRRVQTGAVGREETGFVSDKLGRCGLSRFGRLGRFGLLRGCGSRWRRGSTCCSTTTCCCSGGSVWFRLLTSRVMPKIPPPTRPSANTPAIAAFRRAAPFETAGAPHTGQVRSPAGTECPFAQ